MVFACLIFWLDVVHIVGEAQGKAEEDLGAVVKALFSSVDGEKPSSLWHCYSNQTCRSPIDALPRGLTVSTEADLSLSFDAALEEAESIFKTIYPEEEFIPLVPNPEDVIYVR